MEIGLLEIEFNLVLIILLINAIKPETGKKKSKQKVNSGMAAGAWNDAEKTLSFARW